MKHDGIIERVEELRKYTIGDKRKNPLKEARDFVRGEFPDWKDGCHVLPFVVGEGNGDAAEWKVLGQIYEYAMSERQPMFVLAYVRNCNVDGEMDIVIAHRHAGVKILQLRNTALTEGEIKNEIRQKINQVIRGKRKISKLYQKEFGESFDRISGYGCIPFVVLPNSLQKLKERGILSAEDCESPDSFKKWWEEFIFSWNRIPRPKRLSDKTYLNLLSMCDAFSHSFPIFWLVLIA